MKITFNASRKKAFAERLLEWFASAMRPLPWRETYDPYGVWISEIMLQQTQAERGARYYLAWMRRFPDLGSVARASEEEVLAAWEGLGYYTRARNLQAAARRIMAEHGGAFPQSLEAIRALPGVGEYTAGAIAAIAFNLPEPAVDANVLRIFARICDIDEAVANPGVKAAVTDLVRSLMPAGSARMFVQALMELGALVCAKNPKCGECPVASFCEARRLGTVAERPKKGSRAKYRLIETVAGIVFLGGRVFIRKRPPAGLWAGLWEFPGGNVETGETPEAAVRRLVAEQLELAVSIRERSATVRHGYTTNRVTMHGFLCDAPADGVPLSPTGSESAWVLPEELPVYAFPAGHRKLLERLGWKKEG